MSILNPPDAPTGLINSAPTKGTTTDTPKGHGLVNSAPTKETKADTTSGPGLINGSPRTEE